MTTDEQRTQAQSLLEIRDLNVSFRGAQGDIPVVSGMSLAVSAGETVALVGESGSGKSVTSMSVLGLLPGTATQTGRILFQGTDLATLPADTLRRIRGRDIAMVFQEPMTALNPVYRIGDQIVEAILAHEQIGKEAARARALELMEQVNMPDPARRLRQFPHQLSGGQRQRAMIAMSISSRPRLLIADEPTTALDVTVQAEILDLLGDLQEQLGMGLLIITHDMGVVADIADRVIVMKDGEKVEEAPVAALFSAPQAEYTRTLLAAVTHFGSGAGAIADEDVVRETALEVRDLVVRYPGGFRRPDFTAVDHVSFTLRKGQTLGLVGESGSGKSTIARSLIGLVPIAEGSVNLAGVDLANARRSDWRRMRREVSIVFQDPASSLNPRATIGSSVVAPLRWNGIERDRRRLRDRAGELLDMVRIPAAWASRYPHELSGGQRQRVGIARALAARPTLMIADEPTSALDVSVQATVLELLEQLQAELGFACVFVSHDLSVVEQLADTMVVLRRGEVVEQGAADAVLHHPVEPYTRALIAAAPLPDPVAQKQRRWQRRELRALAGIEL
jgi:peptide/nickel transport system ATP-binding protein